MCACSESKLRPKKQRREENESERVYRKEDKIEERVVFKINKEMDRTFAFPKKIFEIRSRVIFPNFCCIINYACKFILITLRAL